MNRFCTRSLGALAAAMLCAVLAVPALAASKAEHDVAEARASIEKGDLRAAVIHLKNALQREPTSLDARLLLASAYASLGEWPGAEKEIRQARALGAPAEVWKPQLGEALLMQGQNAELLEAIVAEPGEPAPLTAAVLALRGQALLAKGEPALARSAFDESLAVQPGQERARLGLAALLLADGKRAEGLAALDALLADAPGNAQALLLRAELLRLDGRLDAAIADLNQVLKGNPTDLRARLGRALVLLAQRKPDEAERDLNSLPANLRDQPTVRYLRALVAFQRNDLGQTTEHLDYVLRADPNQAQALLLYGAVSYAKGDYQLADDFLARLGAGRSVAVAVRKLQAATKLKLRRYGEAVALLEQAVQADPDDAQLLALLGTAYMQAGDAGKGSETLARAVELDPNQAALRTQLALGRLASGDAGAAASELQTAVDLGQDLLQADVLLVLTHLQAGRYAEAWRAVDALEQRMPASPVPANLRGLVLLAQKDFTGADAAFAQALERDPKFLVAYINRARSSLAAGRLEQAEAQYQAVLALQPSHLGALLGLAALAEQRGDAAGIESWLSKAHAAQPTALQPTLLLAQRFLRGGDGLRALSLINEVPAESARVPAVLLLKGMAQLATGDFASAARTLQVVVDAQPKSIEARFQLGRAQIAGGDIEGARATFASAAGLDGEKRLPLLRAAQVEVELRANDSAQALSLAKAAQRDFPNAAELVDLEMTAARMKGDQMAALDAARRALALQPTVQRAAAYAQMRAAAGQKAEAIAGLREWLNAHPDDTANRTLLALLLHQEGDRTGAIAAYEQVLAANPANAQVLNNLSVLYEETGDPRAVATAKQAYELAPQRPEMVDTYGWALVRAGQVQGGLPLLQQAYVMAPQHPEIGLHVGTALVRVGRVAEARPILERVQREHAGTPSAKEAEVLLQKLK
jgi:putative PEP-CTERM system TPR-repeat lipoprotein